MAPRIANERKSGVQRPRIRVARLQPPLALLPSTSLGSASSPSIKASEEKSKGVPQVVRRQHLDY